MTSLNWNGRVRVWIGMSLAALALVTVPGGLRAEDSNRNEVRRNLETGWSVVWGKNFTEGDWVQGTAAIAESIAAENPGPFLRWFGQAVQDNFSKIQQNLPGVAQRDLERWVIQSIKNKQVVRYKGLEIEAGFATYNRWQTVVYDEPRTRETWIQVGPLKTKGFETYMARVEKKVPLPNWHQFYLRYKLVPAVASGGGSTGGGAGSGGGSGIGAPAAAQVTFQYTIRNDAGRAVTFRLPSGKEYTLSPSQTGSYKFVGNPAAASMQVYSSGRTYKLAAGAHRLWWMAQENRVGLDIAGQ
jgi:hypothetical protein